MSQLNIFCDQFFTNHRTGYGHPENHNRINVLLDLLPMYNNNPLITVHNLDQSTSINPQIVHSVDYLKFLNNNIPPKNGFFMLDEDTVACDQSVAVALSSLKIHTQAISTTISCNQASFVWSRPPGHHALPNSSMGFCIFNNIAYTAKIAQQQLGIQKILILDWDVHHFNGTEDMFYDDSSVLTISMHQYPHWPEGFGSSQRRGEGKGFGYNSNIPMPKESGDWQVIESFEKFIRPQIESFEPELILVSAGFDAHIMERNSGLGVKSLLSWTGSAYSYLTLSLMQLAKKHSNNRILFTLEGGYNLESLKSSTQSVIDTIITNNLITNNNFTTGENMNQQTWNEYKTNIQNNL